MVLLCSLAPGPAALGPTKTSCPLPFLQKLGRSPGDWSPDDPAHPRPLWVLGSWLPNKVAWGEGPVGVTIELAEPVCLLPAFQNQSLEP